MVIVISDERTNITNSLNACLAPVNAHNKPIHPLDMNNSDLSTLSFDKLVLLRRKHQIQQAATGVRKKTTSGINQPQTGTPTERQRILRQLNEIIKEQQEQGTGTGVERSLRWRADAPVAGNAANAARAAVTRYKKVFYNA